MNELKEICKELEIPYCEKDLLMLGTEYERPFIVLKEDEDGR